jgi:hypothetical protein
MQSESLPILKGVSSSAITRNRKESRSLTSFIGKNATRDYSKELLDRLPKRKTLIDIENDEKWEKVSGF